MEEIVKSQTHQMTTMIMIKELDISKIDSIMKIWIEANITTHGFISKDYWKSNYDFVKKILPESTVYVYEEDDETKETEYSMVWEQ